MAPDSQRQRQVPAAVDTDPAIVLNDVSIVYANEVKAVDGIRIAISKGEFVTVVGPSGCGKTTLLSAVAGLLDRSEARVEGEIRVQTRRMGYVFQRDTLLPWRTVLQNVEVGLEIRGVAHAERRERAREYLAGFGLGGFEDAFPHQISGGMRQRVALARTLVYDPDVILMDEPFGAVDAQTRIILQGELTRIWEENHKTILFVTHDLPEAIALAQRTLVFSKRPARVRAEHIIDLPRPRDPFRLRNDRRFLDIYSELWEVLLTEVRGESPAARSECV